MEFSPGLWRMQDFQDGGGDLLFGQNFRENCMQMKKIGPREGARANKDTEIIHVEILQTQSSPYLSNCRLKHNLFSGP